METVGALFSAAVRVDPARPLLTWYDDASGDRTELSGTTLANWVAKTANLLVDGCGLARGDTVGVLLPAHWQTAAVLLAAWSAGLVVSPDGVGDAAFVDAPRVGTTTAPEIFGLALAPMAAPLRSAPPGVSDYISEVRVHGDHFSPIEPIDGSDPALPGLSQSELCHQATTRAAALGVTPGARVLVDGDACPDPLDWLLAPLAVQATIVLSRNVDQTRVAKRRDAERVTIDLTDGRPCGV